MEMKHVSDVEIIEQSMKARVTGLKWSVVASLGAVVAMLAAILSK
ncbi:protein of unknown function [Pararobbsia alpina]